MVGGASVQVQEIAFVVEQEGNGRDEHPEQPGGVHATVPDDEVHKREELRGGAGHENKVMGAREK